ncbi:metallophosphatase domain-containing protein [Candidatus Uabimicrobium sp. HlEnr_7]|uniref:metallophosphatase domain-containing protein n=1 Tax=Candidatus Uabimicrobium helgolandensis TaxID=3095367 RepID=UPI003558C373
MKIIALSDTHNKHDEITLPEGDMLIHAGDATGIGRLHELEKFSVFMNAAPHKYKIVIAGNHDPCYEKYHNQLGDFFNNSVYLLDESITIEGIKFYGTPWTPCHWAYHTHKNLLVEKWMKIPTDTDVLITHMPPYGILDFDKNSQKNDGCKDLLKRVQLIRPKYHIFGHVHQAGQKTDRNTTFINACICDENYSAKNLPICFSI